MFLKVLKFPSTMVNWMYSCISTPKYSISFNRELVGFFRASKGLRQGKLVSPYLFVLATEVLSCLL